MSSDLSSASSEVVTDVDEDRAFLAWVSFSLNDFNSNTHIMNIRYVRWFFRLLEFLLCAFVSVELHETLDGSLSYPVI